MKIITIVCTLNEVKHIERCVESASPLGRVWVIDCGSCDGTQAAARRAGATVLYHGWAGYAAQKNWALEEAQGHCDWVLLLDADEVVTPELLVEIGQIPRNTDVHAFRIPRRNRFLGQDLNHVWWYPDHQIRLLRPNFARFEERAVHERMVVTGKVGTLQSDIAHENLNGISAFFERHLRYAEMEANAIAGVDKALKGKHLKGKDRIRRFIKESVWYRLPQRPLMRLIWLLVVKRGYRDGRAGIVYAQCLCAYEAMIDAYLLEIRQAQESHL